MVGTYQQVHMWRVRRYACLVLSPVTCAQIVSVRGATPFSCRSVRESASGRAPHSHTGAGMIDRAHEYRKTDTEAASLQAPLVGWSRSTCRTSSVSVCSK